MPSLIKKSLIIDYKIDTLVFNIFNIKYMLTNEVKSDKKLTNLG